MENLKLGWGTLVYTLPTQGWVGLGTTRYLNPDPRFDTLPIYHI